MIEFKLSSAIQRMQEMTHAAAEGLMRPISRQYDEQEHDKPWDFINAMWGVSRSNPIGSSKEKDKEGERKKHATAGGNGAQSQEEEEFEKAATAARARDRNLGMCISVEELSWGDAGLYLSIPNAGLGGAAVSAAGTPEQKDRFLSRFREGEPKWAAMAITEPGCGSDTAAIQTTAVRDGDSWVLNGEKIFCTSGLMAGQESKGFVVVWATVDKSAGRAGIKAFIVEAGTPGMRVSKVEKKLGIRASDTASLVFDDCRIPLTNILGSPEVPKTTEGFKGVMATFDATRPLVAASAIGVARASLDYIKDKLCTGEFKLRYGVASSKLTAIERDIMDMETQLHAARLLTWRAARMLDVGERNNLEASMAKSKAGLVVTQVTQKAVELLGPLGYSRECLVEKWMRDAKINDIFEGTQQINMLIVARRILDYSRQELP
jgi:acyl-CoA dehydrogenase